MAQKPSLLSMYIPPKTTITPEQLPELYGRVAIVTGGNSGIGKQLASFLLQKGATVYIVSRSPEKSGDVLEELERKVTRGGAVRILSMDLADLRSVKHAAEEFKSKEGQLHLLFNNAGVNSPAGSNRTKDGYDITWGTNVLGHHAFTHHLLPILLSTASSPLTPKGSVRIVNATSESHGSADFSKVDFRDRLLGMEHLGAGEVYALSKCANLIHAKELSRRYSTQGVWAFSAHPGPISTGLTRDMNFIARKISGALLWPVEKGALTALYAGTASEITIEQSGGFFAPWARYCGACLNPQAEEEDLGKKVWDWCEEQLRENGKA